jgi:YVTN family beta-propeller protein
MEKIHLFQSGIKMVKRRHSIGRDVSSALFIATIIAGFSVSGMAGTIGSHPKALIATVFVGVAPNGLAVTPSGDAVYVANSGSNTVSVISSPTNSVVATIAVGNKPMFVAISPDGTTAFVSNSQDNTVSVISTASHTVTQTVPVGPAPLGLAVKPDGSQLWVCNAGAGNKDGTVSIIDVATLATTNTISIPVGQRPLQVVFSPDGLKAHVLNQGDLSNTGTHVQGYVTQIDATKQIIIGERTFTQDNTAPLGIAIAQEDVEELYISCLQSEKKVLKIGNRPTEKIGVFHQPTNAESYLAGIAGGGTQFGNRYLFIADPGENKLVRIRERWGGKGGKFDFDPGTSPRSVWLGEDSKPLYVAVSPILDNTFGPDVKYVYTTNPTSGTVSVIDNVNIKD